MNREFFSRKDIFAYRKRRQNLKMHKKKLESFLILELQAYQSSWSFDKTNNATIRLVLQNTEQMLTCTATYETLVW